MASPHPPAAPSTRGCRRGPQAAPPGAAGAYAAREASGKLKCVARFESYSFKIHTQDRKSMTQENQLPGKGTYYPSMEPELHSK